MTPEEFIDRAAKALFRSRVQRKDGIDEAYVEKYYRGYRKSVQKAFETMLDPPDSLVETIKVSNPNSTSMQAKADFIAAVRWILAKEEA